MRLSLRLPKAALLPLLAGAILLAACGSDTGAPTDGAATLAGTATARAATAEQQPASQPTAIIPAGDFVYTSGRNADGTYFLGEPDAAVTLIDYSDFL